MLLDGPAWEAVRPEITVGLGLAGHAEEHLRDLARSLDAAWREMAQRLAAAGPEASVRIVPTERGSGPGVGGTPGRRRRAGVADAAAGDGGGDAAPGSTCLTCCWKCTPGRVPGRLHPRVGGLGPRGGPADLGRRAAGSRGVQRRADPSHQAGRARPDPGPALARRPELPAGRHPLGRQRPADRGAGLDPRRRAVGRRPGRLGRRAAFVVPVRTINAAPSPRYFGLKRCVTWMNAVKRAGRRDRRRGRARHRAGHVVHPGHHAEPGRRAETGDDRHRHRLLQRHRLRPVPAAGLPGSPRASPTYPTSGSGGSPCPGRPRPITGR